MGAGRQKSRELQEGQTESLSLGKKGGLDRRTWADRPRRVDQRREESAREEAKLSLRKRCLREKKRRTGREER